jgi:TPR repeat protein
MLGATLILGQGVAVDVSEGVRYFKLSADQEFPPAQLAIALYYYHGHGVEQSFSEASRSMRLSADGGYHEAQF